MCIENVVRSDGPREEGNYYIEIIIQNEITDFIGFWGEGGN